MKTKLWLRLLSILLSVVLCMQLGTTIVFAEEEENGSVVETEETPSREPVGELTEKRTENEKYFLCEDNSILAAVYPQAVHYQDAVGVWQDIDNTMVESAENGEPEYGNTAGAWEVKFAKKAKDGKLARLKYGEHKISWYVAGAEKTEGTPLAPAESEDITVLTKTTSGMRYEDILPQVDLEYALLGDILKENLILKSADAPDTYTFVYEMGGLEMSLEDEKIYLKNGKETVLVLDAPVMTDAALEESFDIVLSLEALKNNKNNHIYALTLTPNAAWLADEAREYPVIVDPVLSTEQEKDSIIDTYTSSNEPSTAYYNATTTKVGMNGSKVYRGYLKFDLPTEIGVSDRVVGAWLQLTPYLTSSAYDDYTTMAQKAPVIEAHAITGDWNKTTLTWNAPPSHSDTVLDYDIIAPEGDDPAYRQYGWDITDLVDKWYTTGNNYGVMLKYDNETSYGSEMVANFVSSNTTSVENGYYPVIGIRYMNMQGLEDCWTYHSLDAGVGGVAYINDFTGAMTSVTPLVGIASERAPINVSLIYSPGSNDSSVNALNVGNGFMLNVQSYMKKVTVGSVTKYKYVDGDGTAHYFEEENGKWIDDGGMGLTFDPSGEYWKITDKQDNTIEFYPNQGRLLRSTDNDGNVVRLHYEAVTEGNTTKYYLLKVTNAAVDGTHDVNFVRNGTRLERINYPAENGETHYAQFTYTGEKSNIYHLTRYVKNGSSYVPTDIVSFTCSHNIVNGIISCPYDKTNAPTGSETQALKGTALRFTYNYDAETSTLRRRVVSYKKQAYEGVGVYGATEYAASVAYGEGSTKFTSTLGETRTELYTFNRYGQTVTAQDIDGNALFQSQGLSGGAENKVTFTSVSQHAVINLVKNHNFEKPVNNNTPDWYFYGDKNGDAADDNSAIKGTAHSEPTYMGALGMKVYKHSASSTTDATAKQSVTLTGGKVYTLSAYVKTAFTSVASVANAGACIGVERLSAPVGQFYTNAIVSADGYTRQFVTIDLSNVEGNYAYDIILGIKRAAGVAYFDCVQLEEGSVVNSYNILENAGFEQVPSNGWEQVSPDNMDGRVQETERHRSGTYGYKMKGSPKISRMLTQTIPLSGTKGDSYTAGVWIKTGTLPCKDTGDGTQQNCGITLEICGTNGTSQYFTEMLDSCNTQWRYICVGGVAKRAYSSVKVYLKYSYNANVTYFDDANLFADTFGQSYTYDANGNVTSVVDLANTTSATTVNGNNDLTSYTDGNGKTYTFTYNEDETKHQLLSATDPKDMDTNYSYNSYGNVTQVNTVSTGGLKMRTSTTYTADGHYVKTETDTNGAVTEYVRDPDTGRINGVYTPSSTSGEKRVTSYGYDDVTGALSAVYAGIMDSGELLSDLPTSVTYDYLRGNLTDIERLDDGVKQTGYHFAYDSLGRTTGVSWSGKSDNESTLQTTTYQTGTGLVNTLAYANGDTISYTYNKAGLTTGIYANGTQVEGYEYNANHNLGHSWYLSDAGQKIGTHYFYDLAGRISGTQSEDGFTTDSYTYDLNNNLTGSRSALKSGIFDLAYTTQYVYNESNNITRLKLHMDDGTAAGKTDGTIRFGYDGLGRLTTKKVTLENSTATIGETTEKAVKTTYTYKTHTVTENGADVTMRHLQPSTVTVSENFTTGEDNELVRYYNTYNPDGGLSRMRVTTQQDTNGDGTLESVHDYTHYRYDDLGQLTTWKNTGTNSSYSAAAVEQYTYAYDNGGNLVSSAYTGANGNYTAAYTYDSDLSDLLTSYQKKNASGNVIQTKTYSYTAPNGELFVNPTTITNTESGATTTWKLSWEQGRRLDKIVDDSNALVADYDYNENGLRTYKKQADGTEYFYHYSGSRLEYVRIVTGAGTTFALHYIYNDAGLAEYILFKQSYKSTYSPNHALYYIVRDSEGAIDKLIAVRGGSSAAIGCKPMMDVSVDYEYDPYGRVLVSGTSKIALYNPLIYKDYVYDYDTELYYLQSRYYDPEVGRFINSDSFDVITLSPTALTDKNLYAYCDNNPIDRADDGGEFWHIVAGAVIGAASQYVGDVLLNLAEGKSFGESLKPRSSVASYLGAAASGALAATGIGVVGSIAANAAISGAVYAVDHTDDFSAKQLVTEMAIGGVSGAIGGKGIGSKHYTKLGTQSVKRVWKNGIKEFPKAAKYYCKSSKKLYMQMLRETPKGIAQTIGSNVTSEYAQYRYSRLK